MEVDEFAPAFLTLEQRTAREGMGRFAGGIAANAILLLALVVGKSMDSAAPLRLSSTRILLVAPSVLAGPLPELPQARMIAARAKPRKANLDLLDRAKAPISEAPMAEAPLLRASTATPLAASFPMPTVALALPPPKPVIGSFSEAPVPVSTKNPEQTAKIVAEVGGFSNASGISAKRGATTGVLAQVSDSGFGSLESRGPKPRASLASVTEGVTAGGFDSSIAAPYSARKSVTKSVEANTKAVEILGKTRPMYTEAARRLRIEGEVLLRILFGADGKLKVQSIMSGLGHGLDENAALSAAQIQFRPATQNGQAVDQTAIIRVRFQLAE